MTTPAQSHPDEAPWQEPSTTADRKTHLTLPLTAPFPTISAVETLDFDTGMVRYQMTGPRLTGSITIAADPAPTLTTPAELIRVELGFEPTPNAFRTDRPLVNGIEVSGTGNITPQLIPDMTYGNLGLRRTTRRRWDDAVPDHSAKYLTEAVRALLHRWTTLPQLHDLMHAHARHLAPTRLAHLRTYTIDRLRQREVDLHHKLADLHRELTAAEELAAELHTLATSPPPRQPTTTPETNPPRTQPL